MRVYVQSCNDGKSYHFGYAFWCNGQLIDRCDEADYHEKLRELEEQGYTIIG